MTKYQGDGGKNQNGIFYCSVICMIWVFGKRINDTQGKLCTSPQPILDYQTEEALFVYFALHHLNSFKAKISFHSFLQNMSCCRPGYLISSKSSVSFTTVLLLISDFSILLGFLPTFLSICHCLIFKPTKIKLDITNFSKGRLCQ